MSMQMDADGESSGALDEMDDLDKYASENESCGICSNIVIDRGVLDCCQHWFCFTCIDNWAAITNRCPLCRSEFQHITCIPVYDATETINEDGYSLASGDDDWYVQGKNNILSFPSYYIDADAVVCLDDAGCKIRGGFVAAADDTTFDTSIACDSCDIWYHAICVGFNPDQTSVESWLCPRCTSTEVNNTAEVVLKQNFSGDCSVIDSDRVTNDASFSGRVSVSVADEGETALVVSMVGGHSKISNSLSEASPSFKTGQEALHCISCPSYPKFGFSHDTVPDSTTLRNTDSFSGSCNKSSEVNLIHSDIFDPTERSSEFSPIRESATTLATSDQGNVPNEWLELPQHSSSYSLVHNGKEAENTGDKKNAVSINNDEIPDAIKSPSPSAGSKRTMLNETNLVHADEIHQGIKKGAESMQFSPIDAEHEISDMEEVEDTEITNEAHYPVKKAKLEEAAQEMHPIGYSMVSSTNHHTTGAAKAIVNDMLELVPEDKSVLDIMSIVEGKDYKRDPGRELAKPVGRKAGDKTGLRVKKIIRRREEEKESSALVQKLQKEIREVVRDTGTSILEKDDSFDKKLLTAFREAIGKSDVPAKRVNSSLIRTRNSLLEKGKIRENLTKKLYGSSTGRKRSTWHRDWEVEFWKYRCSPGIKPEKIETLQSVLQLLKKSSNIDMEKETAQEKIGNNTNSILSRVYLADASVVPRKGDIQPLSAFAGCLPSDKNDQNKNNNCNTPNKAAPEVGTVKVISSNSTGKMSGSSILHKGAPIGRENKMTTHRSKGQDSQNQQNQSASDVKHDKRKWALEVLARKNASSITSKDKTEDGDALKGNYPLLAQLPPDMRPQLATGRHNKVPISIRQAQLYRIAEHYLQKANLSVIRRCADTELAIVDAVNIEKEIVERSNSKSVYVNLCSRATHQHAKTKSENAETTTEKVEIELDGGPVPQQITVEQVDVGGSNMEEVLNRAGLSDFPSAPTEKIEIGCDLLPEETMSEHTDVGFSNVEEALQRAGLFYSPPNSPERQSARTEGNSTVVTISPKSSQKQDTSAKDTLPMKTGGCSPKCIVDGDSQLDKLESLQPTSDSRVRDISPHKYEDSSILMESTSAKHQDLEIEASCQQPKPTSEKPVKLNAIEATDAASNKMFAASATEADGCNVECRKSGGKKILVSMPDEASRHVSNSMEMEVAVCDLHNKSFHQNSLLKEGKVISKPKKCDSIEDKCSGDNQPLNSKNSIEDASSTHPVKSGDDSKKPALNSGNNMSDSSSSIYKKVEAFVKENIRPLCKSGVITVEKYRWAVAKTTDKVMKYHCDAKNANFLIKECDKVKKLALQYVEAAQQKN